PCGFCGGSDCQLAMKGQKWTSTCSLSYNFRASTAGQSTDKRPSSNIPIICKLDGCREVHWKYNFPKHLEKRHAGWQDTIMPSFVNELQVSDEEQRRIGIRDDLRRPWLVVPVTDSKRTLSDISNITGPPTTKRKT
ncbi:hypothetical protein R3P38DRAFT_2496191, partial [Favolaschia claudopus]